MPPKRKSAVKSTKPKGTDKDGGKPANAGKSDRVLRKAPKRKVIPDSASETLVKGKSGLPKGKSKGRPKGQSKTAKSGEDEVVLSPRDSEDDFTDVEGEAASGENASTNATPDTEEDSPMSSEAEKEVERQKDKDLAGAIDKHVDAALDKYFKKRKSKKSKKRRKR